MSKGNNPFQKAAESKGVKKTAQTVESTEEYKYEEFFNNTLKVPPAVAADIESKGLSYRWKNANEYRKNYNTMQGYWTPYTAPQNLREMEIGANPEGKLIRGDLILAVRPEGATKAYRAHLDKRNRAHADYNKQKAQELRKSAAAAGEGIQIHEGYEDND